MTPLVFYSGQQYNIFLIILLILGVSIGHTYYLDQNNGDDSNRLSVASAFASGVEAYSGDHAAVRLSIYNHHDVHGDIYMLRNRMALFFVKKCLFSSN